METLGFFVLISASDIKRKLHLKTPHAERNWPEGLTRLTYLQRFYLPRVWLLEGKHLVLRVRNVRFAVPKARRRFFSHPQALHPRPRNCSPSPRYLRIPSPNASSVRNSSTSRAKENASQTGNWTARKMRKTGRRSTKISFGFLATAPGAMGRPTGRPIGQILWLFW